MHSNPLATRADTRTLTGGGGGDEYSYIHVLPDEFLFKSYSNCQFEKEICLGKHEYTVCIYTPSPN